MWRGGDITVLPLKNAFKSSYPDRGTHVPRPRYTCIPTEVHMYPDRGQGRRIKLNFPSTAYLSSPHSIPLSVVLD